MTKRDNFTFEELVRREDGARSRDGAERPKLKLDVAGTELDEPWVRFTNRDWLGVAFSGGGIRSASFNLGVLQTLARKGLLDDVDYLSTVSGGGYTGGFWSALRRREQTHPDRAKSQAVLEVQGDASPEPNEIRHLRQFSRFLMPRVGSTRLETWAGILAVAGGMVPTLLLTAAVLGLACCAFVTTSALSLSPQAAALSACLVGPALALLVELTWRRRQDPPPSWQAHLALAVLAAFGGAAAFLHLATAWSVADFFPGAALEGAARAAKGLGDATAGSRFAALLGGPVLWELRLAAVFALSGAFAFVARALTSRFKLRAFHAHLDRVAVRFLAFALLWSGAALVWEGARLAREAQFAIELGASGLVTGGLFLWLREWLLQKPEESRLSGALSRALTFLKPAAPQLLAFCAAAAFVVAGTAAFQAAGLHFDANRAHSTFLWRAALVFTAVLLGVGLAVDTSRVGLHAFYRRRIARAFLGATKATVRAPQTVGDASDDFPLAELRAAKGPVHLVCCTANDVQGEALRTLGRGGRSVTVSPFGISLGAFARDPGGLKLGAALTASAAAFNSQMGTLSMQLGRAVSLLTCAFNLRLGLWVSHPLAPALSRWGQLVRPLWRFLLEAGGMTVCDPVVDAERHYRTLRADEQPHASVEERVAARLRVWQLVDQLDPRPLHLSDGGHFENLGLYELVRRHCRYLIVSDAGADPESAFDDLGNAIRRVREDFSVEVDIDVEPLRPVNGVSAQAAVVGTIHYDGLSGSDKGTLLYLKPTLIGSEPPDVLQYRSRNATFPHQGTADQFYDEAQWESYRRLGEFTGAVALGGDSGWEHKRNRVDALFLALRQRWHASPARHADTFLDFTRRCAALESEIRASAPLWFRLELFPELLVAMKAPATPATTPTLDELNQVITWVMQLAQVMEDVWLALRLDAFWSHPLNEGWMAYFHRWASTPSFRTWWPVLRPIYSEGLRNFVKDRFEIYVNDPDARLADRGRPGATLKLVPGPAPASGAGMGLPTTGSANSYHYLLSLEGGPLQLDPFPVASLSYEVSGTTASWEARHLLVPRSLIGSGVQARFLDRLIVEFSRPDSSLGELKVRVPEGKRDVARRADQATTIAFYKSRGFTYDDEQTLVLKLPR